MIQTQNAAGGGVRRHRTIDAAARRIAGLDRTSHLVYLGYRLANCTGIHAGREDEIGDAVRDLIYRETGYPEYDEK